MRKKCFIVCLLFAVTLQQVVAQKPRSDGSHVDNVTFTDIYGNTHELYNYLDQGYSVFIDISATWCEPCWNFKKLETMNALYEKYGPNGTVDPGKIFPIFIEGDPKTTLDDLQGNTSGSRGDWISGANYPIIDIDTIIELAAFYDEYIYIEDIGISYPTMLMICPDRKLLFSSTGFSPTLVPELYYSASKQCNELEEEPQDSTDIPPTHIGNLENDNNLLLYPNPVDDVLNVSINKDNRFISFTYSIIDLYGRIIDYGLLPANRESYTIEVDHLPAGSYFFLLQYEGGKTDRNLFVKR